MMSSTEGRQSGDYTETETLKSVLSNDGHSSIDPATGWHTQEGKQRSEDIDKYLIAESSKLKRQFKVLVLGMIEPKDIFWKQTWLLENPLIDDDREAMRPAVQKYIFSLARTIAYEILEQIEKVEGQVALKQQTQQLLKDIVDFEDEDLGRRWLELSSNSNFIQRLGELKISQDSCELKVLERQCSMWLDSTANNSSPLDHLLQRALSQDYKPTDHDYLHFDNRRKASHLREAQLQRDSHLLRFLDLQQGRGERKKWIHFFEDTRCVVFVTDLGTYGQSLVEDGATTLLHESLMLFDSVARSKWFLEIPMICVLSNVGAFKRKLKDRPMTKWFPEYDGASEDEAVKFMVEEHRKVTGDRKGIEVHACDELDAGAINSVVDLMEKTALKELLEELSIIKKTR